MSIKTEVSYTDEAKVDEIAKDDQLSRTEYGYSEERRVRGSVLKFGSTWDTCKALFLFLSSGISQGSRKP